MFVRSRVELKLRTPDRKCDDRGSEEYLTGQELKDADPNLTLILQYPRLSPYVFIAMIAPGVAKITWLLIRFPIFTD